MASLTFEEEQYIAELFDIASGWVLDFSNATFESFFGKNLNVNIYDEEFTKYGDSKGKRLKAFLEIEDDNMVALALKYLVEYYENRENLQKPEKVKALKVCKSAITRLTSQTSFQQELLGKKIEGLPYIQQQTERMYKSLSDNDSALAIGTAKELVESCCKTILNEENKTFNGNVELPKLVKETLKALQLTSEDIPEQAKALKNIKVLLNNLSSIIHQINELRNQYGTGHGDDGNTKGLQTRHAQLAVGSAVTLVTFLFDTYDVRSKQQK